MQIPVRIMNRPSTVIIGSGNLARAIAQRLMEQKWPLRAVVSTNHDTGRALAGLCGAEFWDIQALPAHARVDLALLCVPDAHIEKVSAHCRTLASLLVHHAGTVSIDALGHGNSAVVWPVMSFSGDTQYNWALIPLLWEFRGEVQANAIFSDYLKALGGPAREIDETSRRRMHLAAVFANNYTNACIGMAQQLANQADCSPDILNPLIAETFRKVMHTPAETLQTGPAQRGDVQTMDIHLNLLRQEQHLADCYRVIASYIMHRSKKNRKN